MNPTIAGLALAGLGIALGIQRKIPTGELCIFEMFDPAAMVQRGSNVTGSPIKCVKSGSNTSQMVKDARNLHPDTKGNPNIVCTFILLNKSTRFGVGLARRCERVKD